MKLLISSAQQGCVEAQNNLGIVYSHSTEPLRDYVESYAWYAVAFANGKLSAEQQQAEISKKMSVNELAKANELAHKYVLLYLQKNDF